MEGGKEGDGSPQDLEGRVKLSVCPDDEDDDDIAEGTRARHPPPRPSPARSLSQRCTGNKRLAIRMGVEGGNLSRFRY